MFVELPFKAMYPDYMVWSLIIVAFAVTFYAVYIPLSKVNSK